MHSSATLLYDLSIDSPAPMSHADQRARLAALDAFLRQVERRALRVAELACGQREDALDIVQDAMLSFARRYAGHPQEEWPPLFHRVLDNRILDHHRRQTVRGRWLGWLSPRGEDDETDPLAQVADYHEPGHFAAWPMRPCSTPCKPRCAPCRIDSASVSFCASGKVWTWPTRRVPWIAPKAVSKPTCRERWRACANRWSLGYERS